MNRARPATAADLEAIRHLLAYGRRLFRTTGDEDLPLLVERQRSVVGEERGRLWGFAGIALEERPETLPATAPERAYLRLLVLAGGHSLQAEASRLMKAAAETLRQQVRPVLLIVHANEQWLADLLAGIGFSLTEEVQTFRLDRLAIPPDLNLPVDAHSAPVQLRPLYPDDLDAVAQLDAIAFAPLWHFGVKALWELLFAGEMEVAVREGEIIGYWALTLPGREAHLTRIAVHPNWQGHGIGRLLLAAAIGKAQARAARSLTLNTQVSNQRSQQLYRAFGFKPTAQRTPVYTQVVAAQSLRTSDQSP